MTTRSPNGEQEPRTKVTVARFANGTIESVADVVAVEEPLEIRVVFGPADQRRSRSLSITMRTPGNDLELAIGFLWTEGLINQPAQVIGHEFCGPPPEGKVRGNTLLIELATDVVFDTAKLQRHFYTTSSCGICGKASLDAVRAQGLQPFDSANPIVPKISTSFVCELPASLRTQQAVFAETGGLHAAGLFDREGHLIVLREDVGRHNAVDKLLGSQLQSDPSSLADTSLANKILVVSGRASFELVQKALVGGIPIMVAVGAPSSLAVELAAEFGMTLIGFNSGKRFNIYTGEERVDS